VETFNKKEREKKKEKRKKEKQLKKEARKENAGGGWESMLAYVDANGNITDTPPDPEEKEEIAAEDIVLGIPKKEETEEDTTIEGTISFYEDSKGYGFIKDDNGENYFFHRNNTSGNPAIGKKVKFEKERNAKGWAAVNVVVE